MWFTQDLSSPTPLCVAIHQSSEYQEEERKEALRQKERLTAINWIRRGISDVRGFLHRNQSPVFNKDFDADAAIPLSGQREKGDTEMAAFFPSLMDSVDFWWHRAWLRRQADPPWW